MYFTACQVFFYPFMFRVRLKLSTKFKKCTFIDSAVQETWFECFRMVFLPHQWKMADILELLADPSVMKIENNLVQFPSLVLDLQIKSLAQINRHFNVLCNVQIYYTNPQPAKEPCSACIKSAYFITPTFVRHAYIWSPKRLRGYLDALQLLSLSVFMFEWK